MNVLLTCAGRRNYLVSYFREALAGAGRVFAADARGDAPALAEADSGFVVPPVDEPEYVPRLLDLCRAQQVRLVVPLNDLELPILARSRHIFLCEGVFPLVPSESVVDICFDKWNTYEFLSSYGLSVPRSYRTLEEAVAAVRCGELEFPVVVKPRWGSASIAIEHAEDEQEMKLVYRLCNRKVAGSIVGGVSSADPERALLIQPLIEGTEYGLDVVNDFAGQYVATLAKRKLGMRAGETDRALTVRDRRLEKLGEVLGTRLGHIGNLDVDVIVAGERAYVLEVNPRFGGGYPFSHAAGANIPAALLAWANGSAPSPDWFCMRPGIVAAKCDRVVIV